MLNEIIKRRIFVRAIKMEMKMKTVCVDLLVVGDESLVWAIVSLGAVGGHALLFVIVAWAPYECVRVCGMPQAVYAKSSCQGTTNTSWHRALELCQESGT